MKTHTIHRLIKLTLLGIFLSFFITSCSIEKRNFRPGYFIQWHKNYHSGHTNKIRHKNDSFTANKFRQTNSTAKIKQSEIAINKSNKKDDLQPIDALNSTSQALGEMNQNRNIMGSKGGDSSIILKKRKHYHSSFDGPINLRKKQVKEMDYKDQSKQNDRTATIVSSVGFSLAISSVILLYVGAFSGALYLLIVASMFSLVGLILCAIGLHKAKRTWPKVASILGIIGCSIILGFMILIFVAGALM